MHARPIPSRPNGCQRLVRSFIAHCFTSLLIPLFRRLYGTADAASQLQALHQLPAGTLGRGVADLLLAHGLELIPRYESHDLKHVLLGYAMTPLDELKLKAFMLGNGDRSISSLGLGLLGLLMPEAWPVLWQHFQRGRRTRSIVDWTLPQYATQSVAILRQQIGLAAADACALG